MGEFRDLISNSDEATRSVLQRILDIAEDEAPDAVEALSYGAPALRYRGKALIGVTVSKEHLSLIPFSPPVVVAVTDLLGGFSISKGLIRFTTEQPVPEDVVRRIVQLRKAEIDR